MSLTRLWFPLAVLIVMEGPDKWTGLCSTTCLITVSGPFKRFGAGKTEGVPVNCKLDMSGLRKLERLRERLREMQIWIPLTSFPCQTEPLTSSVEPGGVEQPVARVC